MPAARPTAPADPSDMPDRVHEHDSRLHPLIALRAVRALFARPDDTAQVFVILRALRGRVSLRLHHRLAADPVGRAILADPVPLAATLADPALGRLPPGTLGRVYHDFMTSEGLSAAGLAAAAAPEWHDAPNADVARMQERLRDMHDLGHVLTGYGRDPLGELCLLAFTFAQTGNLGMGFIAVLGVLRLGRAPDAAAARAAVVRAWLRGRRARWLGGEAWEHELDRPLADVRRRMRLAPAGSDAGCAA